MIYRLREERVKQRLSINALSRLTGIGASDLSMLERGQRPAYPGWRLRIARALKVQAEVLFGDNGHENTAGQQE